MNILPFTAIFILILTLSSMSLFQGVTTTGLSQNAFSGHMAAVREARNDVENKFFQRMKKL